MLSRLVLLLSGRPAPGATAPGFVTEVEVRHREPRNARVEGVILICWLLIAVKHVAVLWAAHRFPVPFNALWINAPTWLLGVLATTIYYWRVRR